MTPKEKAKELVERFYFSLPNNGSFSGVNSVNRRWDEGKQCALIAVDEIIEVAYWNGVKDFYKEVKQEIEKL